MLTIKKIADGPCFLTGKKSDCVSVHFKDKSFAGDIEWNELLKIIKRKTAEAEQNKTTNGEKSDFSKT